MLVRPAGRSGRLRVTRRRRTRLATFWPGRRGLTVRMPGMVTAGARRYGLPISSARADSVAGGLAARPGQGPVPAEQDLREALRGFLMGPIPLQLTTHLNHAGRFAAGQGDAVQPGLVRLG